MKPKPTTDSSPMDRALALRDKRNGGAPTLLDMLQQNRAAIARRLKGDAREADRLIAVAYDAVSRNPQLLKCDAASIVMAVRRAAEHALDLSPVLGHCAIVPRWNGRTKRMEAHLEVMYKGLVELAYRSGKVRSVWAQVVYDCDGFSYRDGLERSLVHEPLMDRPEGAALVACYAVAELEGGGRAFAVLSRSDVEKRRAASPSWQAKEAGKLRETVWDTDEAAMWRKSAIRALSRDLPLSVAPALQQAAAAEEAAEIGLDAGPELVVETEPEEQAQPEQAEAPREREPGEEG